jgi:hypothetical protein
MTVQKRELYRSAPDGDCWFLVRETASARVFVEHAPNLASGGRVSRIEIGDFLAGGRHGPEQQALLRLIGTLLEQEAAAG